VHDPQLACGVETVSARACPPRKACWAKAVMLSSAVPPGGVFGAGESCRDVPADASACGGFCAQRYYNRRSVARRHAFAVLIRAAVLSATCRKDRRTGSIPVGSPN